MYLYRPYKQFSTTKFLPHQMVPISAVAQGLLLLAYNVGIPGAGFQHATVNHSVHFVDPNTGANTQRIGRSWKAAKERNKRHNGTKSQLNLIHV